MQKIGAGQEGVIQGKAMKLSGTVKYTSDLTGFVWVYNGVVRQIPLSRIVSSETIGFVNFDYVSF